MHKRQKGEKMRKKMQCTDVSNEENVFCGVLTSVEQ